MAKAPAPPQADATAAPPPKKSKKFLILVIALLVVLVLVVAGVGALLMLKKSGADAGEEAGKGAAASAGVDLSKPPTFVALDPFVVNLAPAEGDRYLQVVMALRVADAKTGDGLKGFMPEIRHRINLLLASKLPSELSTREGQEDLAAEIVEQVNDGLGFRPGAGALGPVQAVLFNSFIIQ